jgi:BASS family bile acid:Na+ symporter
MEAQPHGRNRIGEFIHRHFLILLVSAYVVAAVWPEAGSTARQVDIVRVTVLEQGISVSLPMFLLAGLLLNAGLGAEASELARVVRKPQVVAAGLAANVLVPVGFLFCLSLLLRLWHDHDEAQNLLLGLAVVAAMPVAGSSTAWSQNAGGNLALSLGLVILSTLLSPLTTPLTLLSIGPLLTGEYARSAHQLAGNQTGAFLVSCVVLPSLAGLLLRPAVPRTCLAWLRPKLRLANSVVLLLLCYINASVALPHIVAQPDWDLLAFVAGVVLALCLTAFAAGWLLARALGVDEAQQRSLVFGLGMNNNGTGLVLAAASLATLPDAVLPVLTYNLVQHLAAGGVNLVLLRAKGQRTS